MSIIDAHCSIGQGRYIRQMAEELLAKMDRAGIDQAVVGPAHEYITVFKREGNDEVLVAVRCHPDRFVGFATVNPWYGLRAVEELRRAQDVGLRGLTLNSSLQGYFIHNPLVHPLKMVALKLHPWLQTFSVVEENLISTLQTAVRMGWPVIFHDSTPPYSTPLQIAFLAQQVLEATEILGHAGLSEFPLESLAAAQRCPNILLCPCSAPLDWMRVFVAEIGCERILYGSDYPFGGPASLYYYLAKIYALELSEQDEAQVLGAYIRRVIPAIG
jgi:predicted TIM-barrel fold metal-dependent hydrolase